MRVRLSIVVMSSPEGFPSERTMAIRQCHGTGGSEPTNEAPGNGTTKRERAPYDAWRPSVSSPEVVYRGAAKHRGTVGCSLYQADFRLRMPRSLPRSLPPQGI
jgi:hypothetical protein